MGGGGKGTKLWSARTVAAASGASGGGTPGGDGSEGWLAGSLAAA